MGTPKYDHTNGVDQGSSMRSDRTALPVGTSRLAKSESRVLILVNRDNLGADLRRIREVRRSNNNTSDGASDDGLVRGERA